jgi:4-amino-4-deoxy-L-arabinose transferase-like glycosyltransferase
MQFDFSHRLRMVCLFLIAFALRTLDLGQRPIWYDEAFSVFLAEQDLASIVRGTAADVQPPLYYFLLHIWRIVGAQPFTLRWLSVALSMLSASLVYALAHKLFSRRAAALALFFCSIAPFQIYHAQELRMYGLLALGALIYLYGVTQISSPRNWFLIILGAIITLYAQALAVFTLVAANVYLLFTREWRAQIRLLGAQVVALVAFAPWLIYVPSQIENIQRAYWTQPPGIVDVLQMLITFTMYLPLPPIGLALALFVALVIGVLAAIESFRLFRRVAPPQFGLIVAFVVAPPILMFGFSYMMRPIFTPRAAIVSSLAYYLLLANLAVRATRPGRIAMVGIAGIIAISMLPFYYAAFGEWRRAPFVEANQFLRAQVKSGDLILHDNKLSYLPMRFYDRALPQEFLADPAGAGSDTLSRTTQAVMQIAPVDFDLSLRNRARVWFIIFQTAIDEAIEAGHPHGNLSRLDAAMHRRDVQTFGDVRIILYETR